MKLVCIIWGKKFIIYSHNNNNNNKNKMQEPTIEACYRVSMFLTIGISFSLNHRPWPTVVYFRRKQWWNGGKVFGFILPGCKKISQITHNFYFPVCSILLFYESWLYFAMKHVTFYVRPDIV